MYEGGSIDDGYVAGEITGQGGTGHTPTPP